MHLDLELLTVPTTALKQTRGKIKHTARIVREMVADGMAGFVDNDLALAEEDSVAPPRWSTSADRSTSS